MSNTNKTQLVANLHRLLDEAFSMHSQGAIQPRLGRSYGYADGYMRVLLDTGVVTESELLTIVADARARHAGPATRHEAA